MAARMGNAVAEVDKQAYFTVEKCVQSASAAVAPTWTSIYVSPGEYPELGLSATFGARIRVQTSPFLNAICPPRLGIVPMCIVTRKTNERLRHPRHVYIRIKTVTYAVLNQTIIDGHALQALNLSSH
jgi:hypothetical protein